MSGIEDFREEGRYRRLGKIGAGGMAEVYLAQDVVLPRKVVLKVLSRDVAHEPEFALRLAGEAKAMAALETHANIVQIFDVIMDGDELCLVLEFVDGMNFRQFMATPDFTKEIALRLLKEVALALAYLHDEMAFVHRDIKPANILIRTRDHAIKLIDFGIARFESAPRLTRSGIIGTEYYMAPEVLSGAVATPASDIWSLGIVMREAMRHLRDRNPDLPFGALDSVILDMTEEDPSLRPRAMDLAQWDGVDPLAPPAGQQAAGLAAAAKTVPFAEAEQPNPSKTAPMGPEHTRPVPEQAEPPQDFDGVPEPSVAGPSNTEIEGEAANGDARPSRPRRVSRRWPIPAGLAAVALAGWLISPVGPLHGESTPQTAPTVTAPPATLPSTTADASSPSPAQPTSAPPTRSMAGPWTVAELNDRLAGHIYRIAAALAPNQNPMTITAAKTESLPLNPDLQFVIDNQAETSDGKQTIAKLRLLSNRGKVDFTPHLTTCAEMAKAGEEEIVPGVYMVVPTTDTSSKFTGTPVTIGGKSYAILRSECEPGEATTRAIMKAGAAGPAQDLGVHYRLPVRPDGTWDKAALPSLGMFMKSKEGHIVMLEG